MGLNSPEDAIPWVGLYIAIASLICTLAMAADVVRSFWQWKLWFPNRFFTLNASTITLIAIAMKLPVDLTTKADVTKMSSIYFLITMLANFLPSLGLMNGRELLMNTVALGILVVTIIVNISIQLYTDALLLVPFGVYVFTWFLPLILPFSVSLTVSSSRKMLEQRYKELQKMVSIHQGKAFSSKELRRYVKKYWMMTETQNPQFVIACSLVSSACGVICASLAVVSTLYFVLVIGDMEIPRSGYKWSIKIIYIIQSVGIVVGSIAPAFRCFTSISHYNLSKKWSKNQLNVFRVEKQWTQMLHKWKRSHVSTHIPGRQCKIVFHNIKKTFLNFCIALHITILVLCKLISLFPLAFLLILSYCWYFFKLVIKRFIKVGNASNSNENSEIEEFTRYAVQVEDEAKLSKRILKNTLHSITQLLDDSEKKEPQNLLKFLEKSTSFSGVVEFDNDEVPKLYSEEIQYCWSLVVVTLTTIAIALPNPTNNHFKELISSMGEGLQIMRHIEESLNSDGDLVKVRKAARRGWTEVEIYGTWLQIEIQNKAHKEKTSKEILKWLGDEATKVMKMFKSRKKSSIDHSFYKFILASSMYRMSQTILLHYNKQEYLKNDEELLEWISTIIADILSACFTNLPRVIKMKCHHHAIEKRGDNIRDATQLLGRSKKILKKLKTYQPLNIDPDSMAYIDKWRATTMSQISNCIQIPDGGASSVQIQPGPLSNDESIIVTISNPTL